ncbi:hypothetical protein WAI453_002459 [Rhynchosporium graminicola]
MPTTAIPTDAPTVLPNFIPRADIPEGVQVFEHDANSHANAIETRSLLGKRNAHLQVINRFTNGAYHCSYTQRTAGGCNAEFYCGNFNGNCTLGSHIESQFDKIYTQLNCPIGGQYTWPDGGSFGCGSDYYGCGGGSVSVFRATG